MNANTQSDSESNDNDLTANEAVEQIATRIDEADNSKTEIRDEEYDALNLDGKEPLTRGNCGSVPVSYELYQTDVANTGWKIAVKTTYKNQGEKRVRHYATGIGNISLNAAGLDRKSLRDGLDDIGVDISDEQLDEIESNYEWGEEETIDVQLYEDAVVMEKHRLYSSVVDTSALLLQPLKDAGVEWPEGAPVKAVMSESREAGMPQRVQIGHVDVEVEMVFSFPDIDQ